MIHTFFGGVHPAPRKENTRRKPLMLLDQQPDQVIIPLTMSSVGGAQAVVKPGDPVRVGQLIGRPVGDGVPVHASVSGKVEAIEPRPHPWGGRKLAVVISNDGYNLPVEVLPAPIDQAHLIPQELLRRIREAGITGMGGMAFPAYLKLAQALGRVDTLIINAAESEPYVTADQRLLMDRGEQILQGAVALAQALDIRRTVLVSQGDKLNAVERLERVLRRKKASVELLILRTRYPLGSEHQLIQAVTGREIPPGGSAADVKCLVFNAATTFAISEALFLGRPLTHRAVTVSGGAVVRPRNFWVPIGTPLRCLLQSAGGLREESGSVCLLTGGPMMGVAQQDLDAPVVKDTNSLICMAPWERSGGGEERVCLRCGRCVAACPMHLAPAFVYRAVRLKEVSRLSRLHTEDCIQCGCCTFICPSRIPLMELVLQAQALTRKGGEQA